MNTKSQKAYKSDDFFGNTKHYFIWLSILIGGIAVGISINSYNDKAKETVNNPMPAVFSLETLNISKQFVCSCGTCGEKELITCSCPTAIESKQFIEANLKKGLSAEDVTEIVKMTYGHYKG